jgi:S-adenosylmethionine-diacylglycerol 3-amino-3-carboxypropyl transferase
MLRPTSVRERLNSRIFNAVHSRNLIYNTCWEDPRLDRVALDFQPDDRVVVLTSAGCNALDYLLAGVAEVNAVDVNPIQNGLLEFKKAAISNLDYESFWELFGLGVSPRWRQMYREAIRPSLQPATQKYWDKHCDFFAGRGWRKSFYYRGTSGLLAKLMLTNAHYLQRLRKPLEALLAAQTIDEQREIYNKSIRDRFWRPWLRWLLSRSLTLSLAGVPWPQRNQITQQYPGGVGKFIRDCVESVILELPFQDNYFWRVYMQGHYTPDCCPEYVKRENFDRLKTLMPRLHIHTNTVTGFVEQAEPGLSKFTLLDHMDWMSFYDPEGLVAEWNAILEKARPGARVIFRSAGLRVDYIDHLKVEYQGRRRHLADLLKYHRDHAEELHQKDRVHTYGSFCIVDLPA